MRVHAVTVRLCHQGTELSEVNSHAPLLTLYLLIRCQVSRAPVLSTADPHAPLLTMYAFMTLAQMVTHVALVAGSAWQETRRKVARGGPHRRIQR
jgi:hypothetical protein